MRFINISLLAVAYCMSGSLALAQSPDLERRVDSLEHKMDMILNLLQKQNGSGNPAPEENQAAANDVPDGYVPGVFIDVFAPASTSLSQERDDRPMPDGTPSASVSISPSSKISYGEISKHAETKRFANDATPPLVISGYLKINKSGKHTLGIEITNNGGFPDYKACDAKLLLNNNLITSTYSNQSFASKVADVNLASGLYSFKLFFECSTGVPREDANKSITFVMSEPGDHAPKAVSSDRLFIKQ